MEQERIKIGIVQEKPVYLDLKASLQKAAEITTQAASQGAQLVVFGETWFSGYPAWIDYLPNIALWDHKPTQEVFYQMMENAIEVPGPATDFLSNLARDLGVILVAGVNERTKKGRAQGTLYNSILIFSADGTLEVHHRKLMPTYTEKLLYGSGDAHGLKSIETPFGKLGALICWEHWMPLARQTMHEEGETLHLALWPAVKDLHQLASRQYAFEGQCFVVAVGQVLQVKDLPSVLELPESLASDPEQYLLNGGSAVIAPDSSYILEPQFDKEGLLLVEIDQLKRVVFGRLALDVTGHYYRPDLFDFNVNKKRL